jgi:hypothetical protein
VTGRFVRALADHPAPRVLGDVALRYEPSMLIGQTAKGRRTWRPTLAWLAGFSALLFAVGLFFSARVDEGLIAGCALLGATALAAATWLDLRDRRRRCFVVDFLTSSLRLDFVSPIAGRPRTLVLHFDGVRAITLFDQADGAHCLTVDFVSTRDAPTLLREVLVAYITPAQHEDARRLQRVLEGAFGLGAPPEETAAPPPDSFEPGARGPTR